jgi:hypothetical protein
METNPKEVFEDSVRRSQRERASLARLPIETLGPIPKPGVEAAWSAEIERRLVEIDTGTVELIPWDDVRLELFGESDGENNGDRI